MIIRYPNTDEHIKVYDIVRVKFGVNKGMLAIVDYVDREKKELKCRIINTSMSFVFKPKAVEFCYHNTRASAKQWYKQMEAQTKLFLDKYKNINYIANNWFTDYYIVNNITAKTIYDSVYGANKIKSDVKLDWLIDNQSTIELILTYYDLDFCYNVVSKENSSIDKTIFTKLYNTLIC